MDGFYYLHTNGDLIYKRFEPEHDSTFVRRVWRIDTTDRLNAWRILVEAAALDATTDRLRELSTRWHCNVHDLPEYLVREHQAGGVNDLRRTGMRRLIGECWGLDPEKVLDHIAAAGTDGTPDMSIFDTPRLLGE